MIILTLALDFADDIKLHIVIQARVAAVREHKCDKFDNSAQAKRDCQALNPCREMRHLCAGEWFHQVDRIASRCAQIFFPRCWPSRRYFWNALGFRRQARVPRIEAAFSALASEPVVVTTGLRRGDDPEQKFSYWALGIRAPHVPILSPPFLVIATTDGRGRTCGSKFCHDVARSSKVDDRSDQACLFLPPLEFRGCRMH